jgi:D-arabinitol dehydrogenase (NADP+)
LKLNGVVIVANKGIKTKIARQLGAGDEYVELERNAPDSQWAKLKEDYKDGFDVVVALFHLLIRISKQPLVD